MMRTLVKGLLVAVALIFGAQFCAAQPWVRVLQQYNLTPVLVSSNEVPTTATFWSMQRTNMPPLPFNSFTNLDVYYLGYGNSFLVDDVSVDYEAIYQEREMNRALSQLESEYGLGNGPEPFDGDGGGMMGPAYDYPSNYLYLEITQVTNGLAYVTLHGTVPGTVYELLSRVTLSQTNWVSEGLVIGADGQDWTPTTVPVLDRTNSLFLWAKSWMDSDGDGLPDWYELEVSGTDPNNPDTGSAGVSDGYKDSDGDGWTNLQEYQNGTNPNSFNTPPAPQGLTVLFHPDTHVVDVNWQLSLGPVTNYTLERYIPQLGTTTDINISAATDNFEDLFPMFEQNFAYNSPTYRLQAHYVGGDSAWSAPVTLYNPTGSLDAVLVRGPQGSNYIVVSAVPADTVSLRLTRRDGDLFGSVTNFIVEVTNLANGIYLLPGSWTKPLELDPNYLDIYVYHGWYIQAVKSSGELSSPKKLGGSFAIPFFDGRVQLKQNLSFQLRASPTYESLQYAFQGPYGSTLYPITNADDYVHSGLYGAFDSSSQTYFDEFLPYEMNYRYRNFVFDPSEIYLNGWPTTGAGWGSVIRPYNGAILFYPPSYAFALPTNLVTIPALLGSAQSRWLFEMGFFPDLGYSSAEEVGITNDNSDLVMGDSARNWFGLPYLSAKIAWGGGVGENVTLNAGGSVPFNGGILYVEAAQPGLQLVNYFFGRLGIEPLPGQSGFSTTNDTSLLISSVGKTDFQLAGYAKWAVTNGYAGGYGYLGQYFDKALKMTNGTVMTTETGIVSPYGEFFPTEPGPTALVTMPDLDTNQRGTAVVHVVKLQLDVNHDGVMDLSFAGPDNTSQSRPYTFWVNNDYDRGDNDDVSSTDSKAKSPDTGKPAPDSEYRNTLGDRVIPSLRDLEDFARLWICGITTNMYPSLPAGVTAELSWGDKGSPNVSNPTIDIFGVAEFSGGIAYLTNFVTATAQTNGIRYATRLGPGDSLSILSSNSSGWQHSEKAIWCGVREGSGKLTLTFSQGTNTIAEASAYIEVKDIKKMYERWTVGDNPQIAPTNKAVLAFEDLPAGTSAFQYASPTGTNMSYMLLVHDYDLPTWKKDRYAETAFKRLYWQGYEGRFGLFRWPGVYDSSLFSRQLDQSEFNAWRSGAGLRNLLTNLSSQYPGKVYLMAHGYGAVAAGEALRLAATNEIVNTYIAMQGAVASHAYDPSAPVRLLGAADSGTPNSYLSYYTNGAPPYFWNVGGAGIYINYFNTNDVVLTNFWRADQNTKPAVLSGYHWDGTNFSKGFVPPYTLLLLPVDKYEIFSFCDEARCEAIGVQPNLAGPFLGMPNLNLSTLPFPILGVASDHSGQFKSFCADTWSFWREVMGTRGFGLKP